jgi:hypothetical protein
MRLITYLMVAASLVFAFIFLQHHYGVRERFLQWWTGGTTQSGRSAPANSEWPASADHDYRVIIDVSGKGPFMSVIHGAEPAVKTSPKRHKKNAAKHPAASVANQPLASKDQQQPAPQSAAEPPPPKADIGVKSQ